MPHGLSNAMLLPEVTEFSIPAAAERYADCARAIGVAVEKNSLLSLPRYTDASVPKPALRAGIVVRSLGTGGLEEVVALLAQALPAVGVSASLLCSHEGGPIADRLTNAGVDVTIGGGRASSCAEWGEE